MLGRVRGIGPLWVVAVVAGLGAVLRAGPLVAYGTFSARPNYDDGVNFTAAALLTEGLLPYRDYFYAHPPAGPLLLAPAAALSRWVGADRAFALAGLGVVALAAVTIFLLGRLCWKLWGPAAGVTAALFYAVHPEVIVAERTTFMEPALNLACVVTATMWLGGTGKGPMDNRRALAAGVAGGVALTFKAWALAWVLAALVSAPREGRRAALGRFGAGAGAAVAVVCLPFAVPALGTFVENTVFFHLWRPPDGTMSTATRVHEMLGFHPLNWRIPEGRHAATSLFAVGGLAVALVRARRPDHRGERLVAAAYVLTFAAFLAGRSYFTHYNAHLALADTALAGLLVGTAWRWLARTRSRPRAPAALTSRAGAAAVLALVVAGAAWMSLQRALDDARSQSPELVALGHHIRRLPAGECLLTFEPMWGLAGGRLPSVVEGAPIVLDPYGVMVFEAVRDGGRFRDLASLYADPRSQPTVRALLERCRFVILGGREVQFSEGTAAWFRENYRVRDTPGAPYDIWERAGP